MKDNLLEIESQVYGFTVLLFSQMCFSQLFKAEENQEYDDVVPVVKKLHQCLSEERRIEGYKRAINFSGYRERLMYTGMKDLWYYIYVLSNYRVHTIKKEPGTYEEPEEELMFLTLTNVMTKSHKVHRMFNQRLV